MLLVEELRAALFEPPLLLSLGGPTGVEAREAHDDTRQSTQSAEEADRRRAVAIGRFEHGRVVGVRVPRDRERLDRTIVNAEIGAS